VRREVFAHGRFLAEFKLRAFPSRGVVYERQEAPVRALLPMDIGIQSSQVDANASARRPSTQLSLDGM